MTVRDVLDARRTAEVEIRCLRRQIEGGGGLSPDPLGSSWPARVKVPGGDGDEAYVFREGHGVPPSEEYYQEMLERILQSKQGLLVAAERIIESLPPDEGKARAILRYFYCQAMSDNSVADQMSEDGNEYDASSVCRMRLRAIDWLTARLGDVDVEMGAAATDVIE